MTPNRVEMLPFFGGSQDEHRSAHVQKKASALIRAIILVDGLVGHTGTGSNGHQLWARDSDAHVYGNPDVGANTGPNGDTDVITHTSAGAAGTDGHADINPCADGAIGSNDYTDAATSAYGHTDIHTHPACAYTDAHVDTRREANSHASHHCLARGVLRQP